MMRFWLVFLCMVWVAGIPNLFAQVCLQGTVADNGGEYLGAGAEPVVHAMVTLVSQDDPTVIYRTYTNTLGQYRINIAQTGVVDVEHPDRFQLFQNYPNPFNPATVIGYVLARPTDVHIEVYNLLGQKIKTLLSGFQAVLHGQVVWEGVDDAGWPVPAGVYIYSFYGDGFSMTKKMLLLDGGLPRRVSVTRGAPKVDIRGGTAGRFHLQITGNNCLPYDQQDIEIIEDKVLDVCLTRTVSDIDGNVYRTVKIGYQWWMAENLKVTHFRNGEAIPYEAVNENWPALRTPAFCDYNNDVEYSKIYGRLYNWYAAADARNIAPVGWHLPTEEEWQTLELCLGMDFAEVDKMGLRGEGIGGKLKEAGMRHWRDPNAGATNESGFTALPGGDRYDMGIFRSLGYFTAFWTSTEFDYDRSYRRYLTTAISTIARYCQKKYQGYSIRLVKD